MIKRFRFVLVNDLKAYLAGRTFTKIYLSCLIILSLLLIIIWPTTPSLSFQAPQLLLVLSCAQIVILTYLSGRLAVGISLDKEISSDDWLRYTPLTAQEIVLGKWGGIFLIVLFILFSSSPLLVLAYFMEGATIESALRVYFLIPIPIITFINLGLFFRFMLGTPTISSFILNMLTILFFLGLFLTRTTKVELFYLNPWFLLSSLVLSFLPLFISLRKLKKIKRGFSL
jgi:hypothetical protein